jgi:hypothetical protein
MIHAKAFLSVCAVFGFILKLMKFKLAESVTSFPENTDCSSGSVPAV